MRRENGVFFPSCGKSAGNLTVFRLPDGGNMNKEGKMKMKHKRLSVAVGTEEHVFAVARAFQAVRGVSGTVWQTACTGNKREGDCYV